MGNSAAQLNVLKNKWLRFLRLRQAQGMPPIEAPDLDPFRRFLTWCFDCFHHRQRRSSVDRQGAGDLDNFELQFRYMLPKYE